MSLKPVVIASILALGGCAATNEAHQHEAAAPAAAQEHEMHAHMQRMHEQMERIRSTRDPEEKERLMQEHMKAMEQSMGMMKGMMNRPH